MSHFTVMVKVKPDHLEKHKGDVAKAVAEMLAPYQENNMGDCPPQYLTFKDMTDEVEERKNEVIEVDSYMGKKFPESIGKTLLEHYGDEETYVEKYHAYKKDPKTGKYGYWKNENTKWDWYSIGGRWSGLLRVKELVVPMRGKRSWMNEDEPDSPHTADIALIKDIDFEGMNAEAPVKAEEFYQEYLKVQENEKNDNKNVDDFSLRFNVHQTLHQLGIRKCVKPREPLVDSEGKPMMEKGFNGEDQRAWSEPKFEDAEFTLEDLQSKYLWYWEFSTYSVLDDDGWHEKGQMGWWGCSSDSLEDREKWGQSFTKRFIDDESPDTLVVVVDCHI